MSSPIGNKEAHLRAFLSRIDKEGPLSDLIPERCWIWTAGCSSHGYGQMRLFTRTVPAHRCAWELLVGPIPPDLWVLHKCNNRRCVNPNHLYLGTVKDNVRDSINAGTFPRLSPHVGTDNPHAKLTESMVKEIRNLYKVFPAKTIAALYGIARRTVHSAAKESWKHVK